MFTFEGSNAFDEDLQKSLKNKFYEILGGDGVKFTPERVSVTFNVDHEPYFGVLVPNIVSNSEENLLDVYNKRLLMHNPLIFLKPVEDDGFPFTDKDKEVLLSKLEYLKKIAIENDPKKEIDLTNKVIRELDRLSLQVKERFIHAGDDYKSFWTTFIGDGAGGLTQTLVKLRSILK